MQRKLHANPGWHEHMHFSDFMRQAYMPDDWSRCILYGSDAGRVTSLLKSVYSWTCTVFIVAFQMIVVTASLQAADGLQMNINLTNKLFCKAHCPLIALRFMMREGQ